ncbi:MAG: MMPL family transporter [Planctomycetales bacterium]|nr:MMPL family transporter [Planctomycetales bacterium]
MLANRTTFFQRHAIIVLMMAFFLLPFGLRGARMAVRGMRNDVKDWLPQHFKETKELNEFREHFSSEAFIVATWDGCAGTIDDNHFRLLVDKFFPEIPPSLRGTITDPALTGSGDFKNEELDLYTRQLTPYAGLAQRDTIGNRLGLYIDGELHEDWGGRDEKWIRGERGRWFFVTPEGDLYRWQGMDTWVGRIYRAAERAIRGSNVIKAELVESIGPEDGPWYYADPRRLEADLFKSIVTGPSLLNQITQDDGALQNEVSLAKSRLTGVLFGPDGQQTCLLITLTDHGRQHLHQVLGRGMLSRPRGRLLRMAEEAGLQPPPIPSLWPPPLNRWIGNEEVSATAPLLRLGGPPIDNVAIDEEGQITLVRLVGLSLLLGLVIAWTSFRSIPVTFLLFFVGGTSAVASLGFVWWGGSSMDAVLMSMPSLVYVLGLSGAVHIVNYYRDTVETGGFPGNPTGALKFGWKPCTLAAFTTALGLVSLSNADIVPIRKFGIFSAFAVVFTLVLMFTVMPAGLQLWPPKSFAYVRDPNRRTFQDVVRAFWNAVGAFIVRRHMLVTTVSLVIFAIGLMGVQRINTTVQLLKLFHPEAKIIQDYTWLEAHLGKLVPMELVARVDESLIRTGERSDDEDATQNPEDRFRLSFLERMEITENIRKALDERFAHDDRDVVGSSMMAATFAPPLPGPGGGFSQVAMRGAYSRQLDARRDEITRSDFYRVDADGISEMWRVSLRLAAMTDVDYGEFVGDIKMAVEPVMAAYKYRQLILRKIDRSRDGNGFRGAEVLVLGAYKGERPDNGASANSGEANDAGGGAPTSDPPALVDETGEPDDQASDDEQGIVFCRTLRSLLTNAALKTRWHDPADELSEGWTDRLGRYDCVVIVRNDPRYDAVRDLPGINLVDATDFEFTPSPTARTAAAENEPVQVVYTGLVPVVYKAQRTLLNNLIKSTIWAFVSISVVMMLLLRSFRAGIVSMLPNIFPVLVVFGAMGWTKVLVDIGSMMTASVAMGVAVDDTIHFLTWFRRGLDEGRDRNEAIMLAYERCASAMTQTTMIAGLGLSVFALSTFTPTQRFGVLMLTLMFTALIGDLIFLPAILAGPAGRAFKPRTVDHDRSGEGGTAHAPARPVVPEPTEGTTRHVGTPSTPRGQMRQDNAHGR